MWSASGFFFLFLILSLLVLASFNVCKLTRVGFKMDGYTVQMFQINNENNFLYIE